MTEDKGTIGSSVSEVFKDVNETKYKTTYAIASGVTPWELASQVQNYLDQGYYTSGNVFVLREQAHQPMEKTEEIKND